VRAALTSVLVRLALGAAAIWIAWRQGGASAVVFAGALVGLILARPLLELAIATWGALRHENWRPLEGRHFAYKGRTVHVEEDADHRRWIRLDDIRAVAGFTASETALRIAYPDGWSLRGRPATLHLDDETLLAHLRKERSAEALRLTRWVEREIVFPARRVRDRWGIGATPGQRRIRSTSDVVE
jgi:hypothetical protein